MRKIKFIRFIIHYSVIEENRKEAVTREKIQIRDWKLWNTGLIGLGKKMLFFNKILLLYVIFSKLQYYVSLKPYYIVS